MQHNNIILVRLFSVHFVSSFVMLWFVLDYDEYLCKRIVRCCDIYYV